MSQSLDVDQVDIRSLESRRDFETCIEVQHETWGRDFIECVPPAIFMIARKMAGVAAGAFDPGGKMLGFVFGLSGLRGGELAHWSHMLAVVRAARGLGLGRRLKSFQRRTLLASGIDVAYWTYDPLMSRNANLNLNALGARPMEYVQNLYGEDTGSELDRGLGTDRFVVEWRLRDPRVETALAGAGPPCPERFTTAPVVNVEAASGKPRLHGELPTAAAVRVEVPSRIDLADAASRARAQAWRASTRQALLHYLGQGYRVDGFQFDGEGGRSFYLLDAGESAS